MNAENHHDAEPFGPVIYRYTRAQAVADGFQVEVTKTAREAGITFPVFLTRSVFESIVAVPPSVTGQDEADEQCVLSEHEKTDQPVYGQAVQAEEPVGQPGHGSCG